MLITSEPGASDDLGWGEFVYYARPFTQDWAGPAEEGLLLYSPFDQSLKNQNKITGSLLLGTMIVMMITSIPSVRRNFFEVFMRIHWAGIALIVPLTVFHFCWYVWCL
jgi:hypothetical protein